MNFGTKKFWCGGTKGFILTVCLEVFLMVSLLYDSVGVTVGPLEGINRVHCPFHALFINALTGVPLDLKFIKLFRHHMLLSRRSTPLEKPLIRWHAEAVLADGPVCVWCRVPRLFPAVRPSRRPDHHHGRAHGHHEVTRHVTHHRRTAQIHEGQRWACVRSRVN